MDNVDVVEETPTGSRRRERGGGRDGRRASQGGQPPHRSAPYILRNIPTYDIWAKKA
jgi:trimethylamine--corrinoid protein Co-methyltransferase